MGLVEGEQVDSSELVEREQVDSLEFEGPFFQVILAGLILPAVVLQRPMGLMEGGQEDSSKFESIFDWMIPVVFKIQ